MDYSNRTYIRLKNARKKPISLETLALLESSFTDQAAPVTEKRWDTLAQHLLKLDDATIKYCTVEYLGLEQCLKVNSFFPPQVKLDRILCYPALISDITEQITQIAAINPKEAQIFFALIRGILIPSSSYLVTAAKSLYFSNLKYSSEIYSCTIPKSPGYELFYTIYKTETWVSTMFYEREYTSFSLEGLRLLPRQPSRPTKFWERWIN